MDTDIKMNKTPNLLNQAVLVSAALTFFCPVAHAQKAVLQTIGGVSCQVRNGPLSGPTVLLVTSGGPSNKVVSPNAPTPDLYAAQQIMDWPLLRGKLIIIPGASVSDAAQAQKLVSALHPDWLVELRDDKAANQTRLGIHLLTGDMQTGDSLAQKTAVLVTAPVEAESGESNGAMFLIAPLPAPLRDGFDQTTFGLVLRDDPHVRAIYAISAGKATHSAPSVRTRFLRLAAARLLQSLQMVDKDSENALLPPGLPTNLVRVAMYDSDGATGAGPANLEAQISAQTDMVFRRVCAGDIQSGVLKDFDVVIHPGGSGTGQGKNLGPTGLDAEKAFITRGGGFIGICGGDYLASTSYPWSLGCVDADVLDRPHWLRGKADLQVELTPKGKEIFGDLVGTNALVTILYHNGPVLSPTKKRAGSHYEPLAVFKNEISAEKGIKGIMVGSAAIAADQMGEGRVLGISPHPEQTPGLENVVPRAIRWVARRPIAPATDKK